MNTYTYVVEFRGGTYCSQIKAEDLYESLQGWVNEFGSKKNEIKYLGTKTINQLKAIIDANDDFPTELDGLKNIWYISLLTKSGFFRINIVKTELGD